jgi:tetratricopeptide (TPR) repeat protein
VKYTVAYRVVLGAALVWGGLARSAEVDPERAAAYRAVAALSSGDPAQRDKAAKALIELGAEARRPVVEASRSEDPELRARAADLLLKLPWFLPDDSPEVRKLLDGYGKLDVEKRKEVVDELSKLTQHGHDALVRLIEEEPSDDVKWSIVSTIRLSFRDVVLERFRTLETNDVDNAPVLAAAGHAWLPKDVAKGEKLLRQSLAVDQERPANDAGEVEAAFDRLQNLALLAGRYDDVAELLRLRALRGAVDEEGEPTKAVLHLFATHAQFGPLAGFDKDLQTYRAQLNDPRVMFAVGKAYERCGQQALAAAIYRSAFLIDLVSIEDRFSQGDFLMRQGWLDLAEAQFAAVFDLASDHSAEHRRQQVVVTPEIDTANAHFRMAQVAAARNDDQTAAEQMEQAMDLHHKARGLLRGTTEQAMRQEIDWHRLRAARTKGDTIAIQHALDGLVGPPIANPDIANDVVPMLREMGRTDEAKRMFDQAYETIQTVALERGSDPKNNLAWLCARCGERKGEALRMADEATRAMPDNAAFVDTLAEAHFQVGHYAEAVRLETKVVGARPSDRFLKGQLKRFQAAADEAKKKGE